MSEPSRGLPLLSGPPPPTTAEIACRRCNKEFNVIFARQKKCNHCGYSYCQSCADYQALMPRQTGYDPMNVCGFCIEYLTITAAGRAQLKAMPMSRLRNYINAYNIGTDRVVEKDDLIDAIVKARSINGCLPPDNETYYRKYSVPNKVPPNRPRGFFSTSRQGQSSNTQNPPPQPPPRPPAAEFARPDLLPDDPPPPPPPPPRPTYPHAPRPQPPPQPQQYAPPPFYPPPQQRSRTPQPPREHQQRQQYNPPPNPPSRPYSAYESTTPHPSPPQFHTFHMPSPEYGGYSSGLSPDPPPLSQTTRPVPPTVRQQPPSPPQPPPRVRAPSTATPPSLDQLLTMTPESIGALSVGALKGVLFTNHVTVNVANILEKSDLVKKVLSLVEDEKRERERQRQVAEMEEMARLQREAEARGEMEMEIAPTISVEGPSTVDDGQGNTENFIRDGRPRPEADHPEASAQNRGANFNSPSSSAPPQAPPPPPKIKPTSTPTSMAERNGVCVICQDEEANIAIVDCGHLAMCRSCSDLVMASSRECPLCRTRIVTEARLLRIFKS